MAKCHGPDALSWWKALQLRHPPAYVGLQNGQIHQQKQGHPGGRIVFQGSGPLLFVHFLHPSLHPSIHPCSHPSILRYLCRCWPQETSILSSATELVAWFLTSERGLKSRMWSVRRGSIPATNFIPWYWTPQFILPNMCKKRPTEPFCFFWGVVSYWDEGITPSTNLMTHQSLGRASFGLGFAYWLPAALNCSTCPAKLFATFPSFLHLGISAYLGRGTGLAMFARVVLRCSSDMVGVTDHEVQLGYTMVQTVT